MRAGMRGAALLLLGGVPAACALGGVADFVSDAGSAIGGAISDGADVVFNGAADALSDVVGEAMCEDCRLAGMYALLNTFGCDKCRYCKAGQFTTKVEKRSDHHQGCESCPNGWTNPGWLDGEWGGDCVPCPAGQYELNGNSALEACNRQRELYGETRARQHQMCKLLDELWDGESKWSTYADSDWPENFPPANGHAGDSIRTCVACPEGFSGRKEGGKELTGQTFCDGCAVGKYYDDRPSRKNCQDCRIGQYTNVEGQKECLREC